MTVMHLTPQIHQALLDRTLPGAEARELAAHLQAGCEACEGWLAARPVADRLDGLVDGALAALTQASGGAGNDLEFARVTRALAEPPAAPAPQRRRMAGLAVAALALAGLAGLLLRDPERPGWDGRKGEGAQVVSLRLRFAVIHPAPSREVERGVPGQEVPSAASLQFQVELGRAADVVLARDGAGSPEPFFHAHLPAGRTVISVGGQPAAYPLARLAGRQRFLALAAEQAIGPADVVRAARAEAVLAGQGQPISIDVIEVQVR
jgi:hypothetical protein